MLVKCYTAWNVFLILYVCVKYMSVSELQALTWFSDVCRPMMIYHHLTFKPRRVPRKRRCWPYVSCAKWKQVLRWPCSSKRWMRSITTWWTADKAARPTMCRDSMSGTPRKSHRSDLNLTPSCGVFKSIMKMYDHSHYLCFFSCHILWDLAIVCAELCCPEFSFNMWWSRAFLERWLFTKTEICDCWQPQWMVWIDTGCFQEGAAAHKAEDAGNPLGQAYLKYLDALVLEESKALYNFHVGRLLVTQGNYSEAVKRLEAALCWNSQHQLTR